MKEKIKKMWKKHKKKIIIALALIIVIIGFAMKKSEKKETGKVIPNNEIVKAETKDYVYAVKESGTVYSEKTMDVFAGKALPVKEILVKEGDAVEEGEVIARLDASNIQKEIDSTNAGISDTRRQAQGQISSAKVRLDEALKQKQNGTNPQVLSATQQADTLYDQWQQALKTYEDFKRSIEGGYNEALVQADNQKASLQKALEQSNLSYEQALKRQEETNKKISDAESTLSSSKNEVDRIKNILSGMEWEMSQLRNQSETPISQSNLQNLQNKLSNAQRELEALKNPNSNPEVTDNTPNPQILQKEQEIQSIIMEIEQLRMQEMQAREGAIKSQKLAALTIEQQKLQSDLQKAESEYQQAKTIVEGKNQTLLQSSQEVESLKKSVELAELNLETAKNSDLTSQKSREDTLETYRRNAEALKNSYDKALKNIDNVKSQAESDLRLLKNTYDTARSTSSTKVQETNLKYLKQDLEQTEIKAPISGTVTKLNLTIGQVPQSSVATIETIQKSIIKSDIKEYDLFRIKEGMKAEITSEALDEKFYAKISHISPTPKEKTGNQTDVRYEVKLILEPEDAKKLAPGITVRVKYIVDERKNVLTLPSNVIYDKNEKNFILVVENDTIKEVPIEIETENDFEAVVKLDEQYKNLPIISMPEKYSPGNKVSIAEETKNVEEGKDGTN